MKTKVTGYLTQKHGFYYVVLNLPTDEKGKRNRKTLSTGCPPTAMQLRPKRCSRR